MCQEHLLGGLGNGLLYNYEVVWYDSLLLLIKFVHTYGRPRLFVPKYLVIYVGYMRISLNRGKIELLVLQLYVLSFCKFFKLL